MPSIPTIHLNGSSAESLVNALESAVNALRVAQEALSDCAPNARDYYTQDAGAFQRAVREAKARETALAGIRSELTAIWQGIAIRTPRATPAIAPMTAPTSPFEAVVAAYVDRLNARARELTTESKRPLYRHFGFTLGPRHARIYSRTSEREDSGRSARAFFGRDGFIRRAGSWKQVGRILGEHDNPAAFAWISGM